MKTTNEILTDIYHVVVAGPINDLNGGVYKKTRPTESTLEDCTINLISGGIAKFLQAGALNVKIFYFDIKGVNDTYNEDALKGESLEKLLQGLSETLRNTTGYSFDVQSREIYTQKIIDENQHFAILKINFKITNN